MVQTRSAAKKRESEKVLIGDVKATKGTTSQARGRKREDLKSAAPKKRRGRKQREICQLNLDVLFRIAAYIHPIDLLNLARTCKSLRHLLMDRCSAFVWKSARSQVKDLPDCPTDLAEPEYANLVFFARCHGCGKYAKNVLWELRRRYCLDCRIGRLCSRSSCHEVIRKNNVLATEHITIEGETTIWVDREQMESFMCDYKRSSDEKQFLKDKEEQHSVICKHASQCERWEMDRVLERRADLGVLRRERINWLAFFFFPRLEQLGYGAEVGHFGRFKIQQQCKAVFNKSQPLTEKEWNHILPQLLETIDSFRSRRLEEVVYQHRRHLLASEYANYLTRPSPSAPTFDLFPHVVDVALFPPFREIIRADEGTHMDDKLFPFLQLPELVGEWRKKLDAEVAELVKIPSHLSVKGTSGGPVVASSSMAGSESPQAATDKLHLACALFIGGIRYPRPDERDSERTGSIRDRYDIEYVEDAPYVVHACGLDPNTATVDDMDHRNARLMCLSCNDSRVRRWRDAVWHARFHYKRVPSEPPRWQVISDEYLPAIQAVERTLDDPYSLRCLLCLPHVGDTKFEYDMISHLQDKHGIKEAGMQCANYTRLDLHEMCSVTMVEKGGSVTFKDPRCFSIYG